MEVRNLSSQDFDCSVLSENAPGEPDPNTTTLVRVLGSLPFDFTDTYNDGQPLCRNNQSGSWELCPKYENAWWPNATTSGAKMFPYSEMSLWQYQSRTNHSSDDVPYLPNVIAGFDARPWEEHGPSFVMPTATEWEDALMAIRSQCLNLTNGFGFPDESAPNGVQPAFNIYAWNEFAEGGILAPSQGQGFMKVQALAKIFGPSSITPTDP